MTKGSDPFYSPEGRILHVVFTLREGKVRPISARPAHKKERELYEAYLREI
ncbi:MAG: BrnT family toxin [Nitrospira sp.]|nr:BrnT family toxin [Nitrospira sp.]